MASSADEILSAAREATNDKEVLFACEYRRSDMNLSSVGVSGIAKAVAREFNKKKEKTFGSSITDTGWMMVTPFGIHFHRRAVLGRIGDSQGFVPAAHISGLSAVIKRKSLISLGFNDGSDVLLESQTKATNPQLEQVAHIPQAS